MNAIAHRIATAADVVVVLRHVELAPLRRRDLLSSISRMCAVLACRPETLKLAIPDLVKRIGAVRPAAHGMSPKTFSNLRCNFSAALELAGVIDGLGRGDAKWDANWAPLVQAVAHDKRLGNGLATLTKLVRAARDQARRGGRFGRAALRQLAPGPDPASAATRQNTCSAAAMERGA